MAVAARRIGEAKVESPRRLRRKQEIRSRIVEAAIALTDEKGFDATMVSEICTRADVAQKTFFNHFASKQHLLRKIARDEIALLLKIVDAARQRGASGEERVEEFFRLLGERVEGAGRMRRDLLTELVHLAHETGAGSMQARTLHESFRALLREGAKPKVGSRTIDTFSEIVLGTFYALMFNWANLEGYPFRKRASAAGRMLAQAFGSLKQRGGSHELGG